MKSNVKRKAGSILTAVCICGVCGFSMVGMPKAFAKTLDTPKTVKISATPYMGKADVNDEAVKSKVSKEDAIKIVESYVEKYHYDPESFKQYAIKFVKGTSPKSPDKWILAFGDVDAASKYGKESEARINEYEKTGNHPKTKGDPNYQVPSPVLYAEVNATTGEVITEFETYDTNGLTSKNQ